MFGDSSMLPRLLPVIDALYAVRASVTKIKKNKKSLLVINALYAVRASVTKIKKKSIFCLHYVLRRQRKWG